MPKEAWELLPTMRFYSTCKLCQRGSDFQEQFWQWMKQGKKQHEIAELLSVPVSKVNIHRKHLCKVFERYLVLTSEKSDELKSLNLQVQIEREKRKQLELAREREERAKVTLNALRDLVNPEKFAKILAILEGEDE